MRPLRFFLIILGAALLTACSLVVFLVLGATWTLGDGIVFGLLGAACFALSLMGTAQSAEGGDDRVRGRY